MTDAISKPACGNYTEHEAHEALFGNPGEAMHCEGIPPWNRGCRRGHTYFNNSCVRCGEKPSFMRAFKGHPGVER